MEIQLIVTLWRGKKSLDFQGPKSLQSCKKWKVALANEAEPQNRTLLY